MKGWEREKSHQSSLSLRFAVQASCKIIAPFLLLLLLPLLVLCCSMSNPPIWEQGLRLCPWLVISRGELEILINSVLLLQQSGFNGVSLSLAQSLPWFYLKSGQSGCCCWRQNGNPAPIQERQPRLWGPFPPKFPAGPDFPPAAIGCGYLSAPRTLEAAEVPWPLNKQLNSVVLNKSDKNKARSYSHVAKNRSGMWCLPAMHSRSCKGTSWHSGTKGKLLFIARLTKLFPQRIFFSLPFVASLSFPFLLTSNIALVVCEAASSTFFSPDFKAVAGTCSGREFNQHCAAWDGFDGFPCVCPCALSEVDICSQVWHCAGHFSGVSSRDLSFPSFPHTLNLFFKPKTWTFEVQRHFRHR